MSAAAVERCNQAYLFLRLTGNGRLACSRGEAGHHPLQVTGRDGDIGVVDEQIAVTGVGYELDQRADLSVGSQEVGALDELNGFIGKLLPELFDGGGGRVGERGNAEEYLVLPGVALAAVATEGIDHAGIEPLEGFENADAGSKGSKLRAAAR